MKRKLLLSGVLAITGISLIVFGINYNNIFQSKKTVTINLSSLVLNNNNKEENINSYTIDQFSNFLNDYQNNTLNNNIYITEFLFDGISTYKPYDLDDFIEQGNEYETPALNIKTLNINQSGNVELTGDFTGMIAVNTNNLDNDLNIILNNVNINTDSKKVPAIYVYNKDINYTKYKVTINLKENSKNYIEGGKLKKVSLVPSDKLSEYSSKYTNDAKTNYDTYSNYYGVYLEQDLNNILFAKVEADNEDLSDGDPYYFYKAAGAISSDIDLYFDGNGYLEVTSKNKEGIETKGNLTLGNMDGDYVINAEDDCLNTTTSNTVNNARNLMTINVNSLKAIVSNDADEGDAIDSNGELIIENGNILALAKPGQDAGIDSETGTFINGGTIVATGNMYDKINSSSKQNFMVLETNGNIAEGTLITLLNENENIMFAYQSDRSYTTLVYSSPNLINGTYSLYKDGLINGDIENGVYSNITSYEKGVQLGYNEKSTIDDNSNMEPNGNQAPPNNNNSTPPQLPTNDKEMTNRPNNNQPMNQNNSVINIESNQASNKEFIIDGISNIFNGVAIFKEN
ncbi:MAG: carbohydrate-binding domain-containing protein [Bacilli bacterium]|nr:carbohydrate-binding domain-containing protein [Bacilli bacterium]